MTTLEYYQKVHKIILDTTIAPEKYEPIEKNDKDQDSKIHLCIFSFYFPEEGNGKDKENTEKSVKVVTFLKKDTNNNPWVRVEATIKVEAKENPDIKITLIEDFDGHEIKIKNKILEVVNNNIIELHTYFLKKNIGNIRENWEWWYNFKQHYSFTYLSDALVDTGLTVMNSQVNSWQISKLSSMIDKLRRNDNTNENTLGLTKKTLEAMKIPSHDSLIIQEIKLDGAFRISFT